MKRAEGSGVTVGAGGGGGRPRIRQGIRITQSTLCMTRCCYGMSRETSLRLAVQRLAIGRAIGSANVAGGWTRAE